MIIAYKINTKTMLNNGGYVLTAILTENVQLEPSEPTQRIVKVRRDYNTWVANETLEDYALRFTPISFRKWSV